MRRGAAGEWRMARASLRPRLRLQPRLRKTSAECLRDQSKLTTYQIATTIAITITIEIAMPISGTAIACGPRRGEARLVGGRAYLVRGVGGVHATAVANRFRFRFRCDRPSIRSFFRLYDYELLDADSIRCPKHRASSRGKMLSTTTVRSSQFAPYEYTYTDAYRIFARFYSTYGDTSDALYYVRVYCIGVKFGRKGPRTNIGRGVAFAILQREISFRFVSFIGTRNIDDLIDRAPSVPFGRGGCYTRDATIRDVNPIYTYVPINTRQVYTVKADLSFVIFNPAIRNPSRAHPVLPTGTPPPLLCSGQLTFSEREIRRSRP